MRKKDLEAIIYNYSLLPIDDDLYSAPGLRAGTLAEELYLNDMFATRVDDPKS